MNHKFFHGRVISAEQSTISTLLLAACFLAGAFVGNRFAGSQIVYSNHELHTYLSSFTVLLENGALSGASLSATLFSYCKYPSLLFFLGFVSFGAFCIPLVLFYQGFSVSLFYYLDFVGFLFCRVVFFLRVIPCNLLFGFPDKKKNKETYHMHIQFFVLCFALCF